MVSAGFCDKVAGQKVYLTPLPGEAAKTPKTYVLSGLSVANPKNKKGKRRRREQEQRRTTTKESKAKETRAKESENKPMVADPPKQKDYGEKS